MSTVVVDDHDARIQYAGAWSHVSATTGEFDQTKSGTSAAGSTATLTFTGISVAVFGSQGSTNIFGRPVTTYTIDNAHVGTYQAPILAPGIYSAQTLFFQSSTLSPSTHTLVIANTNGTSPSEFWLDYIKFVEPISTSLSTSAILMSQVTIPATPQPQSSPLPSSFSVSTDVAAVPSDDSSLPHPPVASPTDFPSPNSITPSVQTTVVLGKTVTLYLTPNPTDGLKTGTTEPGSNETSVSANSGSSHINVGPIVGGVVGALAALLGLTIFLVCVYRRRRPPPGLDMGRTRYSQLGAAPVALWNMHVDSSLSTQTTPKALARRNPFRQIESPSHLEIPTPPSSGPSPPNSSALEAESDPVALQGIRGSGSIAREPYWHPITIFQKLSSISPFGGRRSESRWSREVMTRPSVHTHMEASPISVMRHHEDSGVRIPAFEVVDVPPAYSQS